jgi:hypothetical protein
VVSARSKYADGVIKAMAPPPSDPTTAQGDLSKASIEQICDRIPAVWPGVTTSVVYRRVAARSLLQVLHERPGKSWQQRWDNSGYAEHGFTAQSRQELGTIRSAIRRSGNC